MEYRRLRRGDAHERFGVILLTENLRAQNVGRELVFSADMCYNDMGDASG